MIVLLQRVVSAEVCINKQVYSEINNGLLILLGVDKDDQFKDVKYLIDKIINLRIFNDANDKMNLSITDIKGEILVVSQFTLLANTSRGRRPSFIQSAKPAVAKELYDIFIKQLNNFNLKIKTGQFGVMMNIKLINNGPATFILNSKY